MYYIATFYSHFGAIRFKKESANINSPQLMPVPRRLSSSCGTCVRFSVSGEFSFSDISVDDELEQIVRETANGYERIYQSKV